MAKCPKCDDVLINQKRCDCGWRSVKPVVGSQFLHSRATATPIGHSNGSAVYVDARCHGRDEHGDCERAGYLSHGTSGDGPWYCREHFFFKSKADKAPAVSSLDGKEFCQVLKDIISKRLVQEEPGANG